MAHFKKKLWTTASFNLGRMATIFEYRFALTRLMYRAPNYNYLFLKWQAVIAILILRKVGG